jgi:hypothetical protein
MYVAFSITFALMQTIVITVIAGPILWAGGRLLVRKGRTSISRAFLVVAIGAGINASLAMFVASTLIFPVTLIVLVGLVKRFFKTGWKRAVILGIGTAIVLTIVVTVLRFVPLIGLGFRF